MTIRPIAIALLISVPVVLCVSPAMADDKADLIAAFNQARKLQDEAKYAEAAVQYEKALKLAPVRPDERRPGGTRG